MVVEPDSDGPWRPLRRKPRPGSSSAERSCNNRNGRITRFVSIQHSGSALRLSGTPPGDRAVMQWRNGACSQGPWYAGRKLPEELWVLAPRSNHGSEELCHCRCTGHPDESDCSVRKLSFVRCRTRNPRSPEPGRNEADAVSHRGNQVEHVGKSSRHLDLAVGHHPGIDTAVSNRAVFIEFVDHPG